MISCPPATPLTKSKCGCMGGVMRRASTGISQVSRPGMPASDIVSLKRTMSRQVIPLTVSTLSPPYGSIEAKLLTPIAESPVREVEALQQETVGPSAQPVAVVDEERSASPESLATAHPVSNLAPDAPYATKPQNCASISPLIASSSGSSCNPDLYSHHGHGNGNGTNQPRLHELGWLEYHLPDGTVYYVHPTRRVTTDSNLRKESVLAALEAWFELRNLDDNVNVGVEGWVREVSVDGNGMQNPQPVLSFERYWVNHIAQTVIKEDVDSESHVGGYGRGTGSSGPGGSVASGSSGEDQLDLEYRFWSFMEAHPAHSALPAKAKAKAMDVLASAWTEHLLDSHQASPSPFTQEECKALMDLLRSFDEYHFDDHGIQTRVVARILLRVVQWRQTYLHPENYICFDPEKHSGPSPPSHESRRLAPSIHFNTTNIGSHNVSRNSLKNIGNDHSRHMVGRSRARNKGREESVGVQTIDRDSEILSEAISETKELIKLCRLEVSYLSFMIITESNLLPKFLTLEWQCELVRTNLEGKRSRLSPFSNHDREEIQRVVHDLQNQFGSLHSESLTLFYKAREKERTKPPLFVIISISIAFIYF
ncbi:hypothetical protein CPB84DRAFT_1800451 [Gymnopilus junonius]|uniref:Uncharacterized protein n=1 Tax=Gymnopilus junonius TaxID=109634 RepID=A0A9P5TG23_GYMJU|nr:hypothetical protein CPB84DRAFT_1800451 [Gymnopilus junonius]